MTVIVFGVAHLACHYLVLNTLRDMFACEAAQVWWW